MDRQQRSLYAVPTLSALDMLTDQWPDGAGPFAHCIEADLARLSAEMNVRLTRSEAELRAEVEARIAARQARFHALAEWLAML